MYNPYFNWDKEKFKRLFNFFESSTKKYGQFSPRILFKENGTKTKPLQNLLIYRIALEMTQIEFAKKLGISPYTLWQYESGNYSIKRLQTAKKYMQILREIFKHDSLTFEKLLVSLEKVKKKVEKKKLDGAYNQNKIYAHKKKEWGVKAGNACKKKHGIEFYKRISRLSPCTGPDPHKVRKRYGYDYYSKIGKKGMSTVIRKYKYKKREWGIKSVENYPPTRQEKRILEIFKGKNLNPQIHKTISRNQKIIGNFDFFFKDLNLIIEVSDYSYKDESLSKILFKLSTIKKLKNYIPIFIIPLDSPTENVLTILENKIITIFDTTNNINYMANDIKNKNINFNEWHTRTIRQLEEYLQKTKSRRENGFVARKNQKLNNCEKKICITLENAGIKYSPRYALDGPYNLKRIVDFFCKIQKNRYVIEVTSSNNFESCAKRLLGKFFAYKKFYKPKAKLIGVVFCPNISQNLFDTNFYVKKLFKIADKVILNAPKELVEVIK